MLSLKPFSQTSPASIKFTVGIRQQTQRSMMQEGEHLERSGTKEQMKEWRSGGEEKKGSGRRKGDKEEDDGRQKTTEKENEEEEETRRYRKCWKRSEEPEEEEDVSYYVVSESLPLLLSEGLTEAQDEFVQFLGVSAQELPDLLQALQAVGGRRAELGRARVHLHRPGDAQDAVALLLVVVEGLLKQDGDWRRSREAGSQQDLPVLDPDLLQHTRPTHLVNTAKSGS